MLERSPQESNEGLGLLCVNESSYDMHVTAFTHNRGKYIETRKDIFCLHEFSTGVITGVLCEPLFCLRLNIVLWSL